MGNLHLWLQDLLLVGAIWALGGLAAQVLLRSRDPRDGLATGLGLGVGILTWALFLLSWAGIRLSLTVVALVCIVSAVALVAFGLARWPSFRSGREHGGNPAGLQSTRTRAYEMIGWILIGSISITAVLLSVRLSYYEWDAVALWSVKGYGIARAGTVFAGAGWGNKGLSYPLNIPLAIGVFYWADGDILPGSKLLFPLFLFSLLASVFLFVRRQAASPLVAALGSLVIGTTPIVFFQSINGYANVVFSFYVVAGVLQLTEGLGVGSRRHALLGGILLALASWTRPEGQIIWAASIAAILIMGTRRMSAKDYLNSVFVPFAVISFPWNVFMAAYRTSGKEMSVALNSLGHILGGSLNRGAIYQIVRFGMGQALKPEVWGLMLPAGSLLMGLLLFTRRLQRGDHAFLIPLVSSVTIAGAVVGLYYLTSFDQDLSYWLNTGFNRMLIPSFALMGTAISMSLGRIRAQGSPAQSAPNMSGTESK